MANDVQMLHSECVCVCVCVCVCIVCVCVFVHAYYAVFDLHLIFFMQPHAPMVMSDWLTVVTSTMDEWRCASMECSVLCVMRDGTTMTLGSSVVSLVQTLQVQYMCVHVCVLVKIAVVLIVLCHYMYIKKCKNTCTCRLTFVFRCCL